MTIDLRQMKQLLDKIVLGTAQFGLDYGINNKTGKIPKAEVYKILDSLKEYTINYIDTAQVYGESENVLGAYIKNNSSSFKIISKIHNCSPDEIEKLTKESLQRLGVNSLYGMLLHNYDNYEKNPSIYKSIVSTKSEGLIEKAGFSLYYPNQLIKIFDDNLEFDIVQIPYNLFDRRFEKYFQILKEKNVEIHVRSVFLQGLFFKQPGDLPPNLKKFSDHLLLLNDFSAKLGITIYELALLFVISNQLIDKAVIGIDNVDHLKAIIDVLNDNKKLEFVNSHKSILIKLEIENETLLIPSNWN